jgi:outer membrane protein TolC
MAGSLATTNETLRDVSLAYWTLVDARGRHVILREIESNTNRLDEHAQSYLRAENLKPADADRVRAQLLARRQETELAERQVRVAAARLARLLRLDPFVELVPGDAQAVPVDYFGESFADVDLATTALSNRPELMEHRALVGAAVARLREARLGPLLPSLVVDVAAGGFGGGPNGFFGDFDGRSDVGAAAIWEFENLGFGDRARIRERASDVRQAELRVLGVMDQVVTDAAEAAANVAARREQLKLAQQAVTAATDSYTRNLQLFTDSGVELILPLEVLQSVAALSAAQQDNLEAVVEYNKSQVQLHWAIGSPVEGIAGERR